MLVGRKNCRKIVQFLVEPLIKKQSISPRVSGFFCILFIWKKANKKRELNGLRLKTSRIKNFP